MSAKTTTRSRRLSADEERLIAQIVAAQITTKAHAVRVFELRQRAVIAAWTRTLAASAKAAEVKA